MRKVQLFYPNNWKKCLIDVLSEQDKKFSWWICGKKYFDEKINDYVLKISDKVKFYDYETGETLKIKEEYRDKTILLINLNIAKFSSSEYMGYVILDDKCSNDDVICEDIIFYIKSDILEKIHMKNPNESLCNTERSDTNICEKFKNINIITYSKKNYLCISKYVKDFPTPKEIDELLEKNDCFNTCKILRNYIKKYFEYKNGRINKIKNNK